jgi:hypothetical protein
MITSSHILSCSPFLYILLFPHLMPYDTTLIGHNFIQQKAVHVERTIYRSGPMEPWHAENLLNITLIVATSSISKSIN